MFVIEWRRGGEWIRVRVPRQAGVNGLVNCGQAFDTRKHAQEFADLVERRQRVRKEDYRILEEVPGA